MEENLLLMSIRRGYCLYCLLNMAAVYIKLDFGHKNLTVNHFVSCEAPDIENI